MEPPYVTLASVVCAQRRRNNRLVARRWAKGTSTVLTLTLLCPSPATTKAGEKTTKAYLWSESTPMSVQSKPCGFFLGRFFGIAF